MTDFRESEVCHGVTRDTFLLMIHWSKHIFAVFAILLGGLITGLSEAAAKTPIAVLMSDSLTATMRTFHGARKEVKRENPSVVFHNFTINQATGNGDEIIDSLRKIRPRAVLTIGSSATRFAQKNFPNIPIVFAAVLYPKLSGFVESVSHPGGNITGASLDIPNDVQFKYFKKIVPDLKKIGVLYSDSTSSLIPPAQKTAQKLGLTLIPVKVNGHKQLPAALDSLAKLVDGIWSLADPVLFNPISTRYILLNTLRKGIPFMGFSRNVVESGALFALDFDYKAVGRQAGAIINRILRGEHPSSIAVTSADIIWFHYNENTAKHIAVTIPTELAAIAKEVYR